MNRYEDRLLELDLREVLGLETPPDVWPQLAPRLVPARAHLRHLRGRGARPPSTARYLPWAAAAAILLALGVFWWVQQPPREDETTTVEQPPMPVPPIPVPTPPDPVPPTPVEVPATVGRADRMLMIAAVDGAVREDSKIASGERVVVPPSGAEIRMPGGASLRFADTAWLRFEAGDPIATVEIARGSLVGESGNRSLALRVDARDLVIDAKSEFTFKCLGAPPDEHESAWLGGFARLTRPDLVVTVSSGRVQAAGKEAAPDEYLIWLDGVRPRSAPTLLADTRLWFDQQLSAIDVFAGLARGHPAARDAEKYAFQSGRDLEGRLREDPAAWGYVVPWLERRVGDLDEEPAGRIALRVLVQDPERRAIEAIHARLEDLGLEARASELLPLAEAATDTVAADTVAIDIMRRKLSERADPSDVYIATFFALRDDDAGRAVLERVLEGPDPLARNPAGAFAAAAGLHRLGQPAPWAALRLRLEAEAERAIEEGRIVFVRWQLTAAAYFAPVVREQKPVPVADANRVIKEFGEGLDLETAQDIRRAVSQLP